MIRPDRIPPWRMTLGERRHDDTGTGPLGRRHDADPPHALARRRAGPRLRAPPHRPAHRRDQDRRVPGHQPAAQDPGDGPRRRPPGRERSDHDLYDRDVSGAGSRPCARRRARAGAAARMVLLHHERARRQRDLQHPAPRRPGRDIRRLAGRRPCGHRVFRPPARMHGGTDHRRRRVPDGGEVQHRRHSLHVLPGCRRTLRARLAGLAARLPHPHAGAPRLRCRPIRATMAGAARRRSEPCPARSTASAFST